MSDPTAAQPITTGRSGSPTDPIRYLRALLEKMDTRVSRLESNRTPAPVQLHQLSNAGPMSQAQPGHGGVYDPVSNKIVPTPVLATALFHMFGALTAATSPPWHARYGCTIVGIAADLGTFGLGEGVTFEVQVNGTTISTITLASTSSGHTAVSPPVAIKAYTDLVTVVTTAIGSGSADLVVHVELGSVVSGTPVPVPRS